MAYAQAVRAAEESEASAEATEAAAPAVAEAAAPGVPVTAAPLSAPRSASLRPDVLVALADTGTATGAVCLAAGQAPPPLPQAPPEMEAYSGDGDCERMFAGCLSQSDILAMWRAHSTAQAPPELASGSEDDWERMFAGIFSRRGIAAMRRDCSASQAPPELASGSEDDWERMFAGIFSRSDIAAMRRDCSASLPPSPPATPALLPFAQRSWQLPSRVGLLAPIQVTLALVVVCAAFAAELYTDPTFAFMAAGFAAIAAANLAQASPRIVARALTMMLVCAPTLRLIHVLISSPAQLTRHLDNSSKGGWACSHSVQGAAPPTARCRPPPSLPPASCSQRHTSLAGPRLLALPWSSVLGRATSACSPLKCCTAASPSPRPFWLPRLSHTAASGKTLRPLPLTGGLRSCGRAASRALSALNARQQWLGQERAAKKQNTFQRRKDRMHSSPPVAPEGVLHHDSLLCESAFDVHDRHTPRLLCPPSAGARLTTPSKRLKNRPDARFRRPRSRCPRAGLGSRIPSGSERPTHREARVLYGAGR